MTDDQPYDGRPVPPGTDMSPNARYVDEWYERFNVVPAADGDSVLVFSEYFEGVNDDGEVEYDEEQRAVFEDQTHLRWLEAVQIHQRLQEGDGEEKGRSRVVRFLGAEAGAYRLEKPSPSIYPYTTPNVGESDEYLALCQRWAMQYLSACRFIHSKGVVVACPPDGVSWLRPNFSLTVANFAFASCRDLHIDAWWQLGESEVDDLCPYGTPCVYSMSDAPLTETQCGQPKLDIFMWANWMYEVMSDGKRLSEHIYQKHSYKELPALGKMVREGTFDDWPLLENEKSGPCLIKAWKGQYETADDALRDVRITLEACGER